ncbi:MAG: sigma-70 family RNA polymerase sigma factor [Thermoanaerobaculia bacterium]
MSVAALNFASPMWIPASSGGPRRSYHPGTVVAKKDSAGEITQLLAAVRTGDRSALDRIFDRLYSELKKLARSQLRRGRSDSAIDTTALVHEAYLKLVRSESLSLVDRGHFFALAAKAMRQILIGHAESLRRQKRGGGAVTVTLDEELVAPELWQAEQLIAVDVALAELERLSPRLARIVELRFFVGLNEVEIGALLEQSERTVRRDWRKARAFLHTELERQGMGG